MGEPDPGRGPARLLSQDRRFQRLSQGRQRITQASQRRRGRELAALAQHRGRRDKLLSRRAHQPPATAPPRPATVAPAAPATKVTPPATPLQHRPAVQRVTAGLLQQTADRPARQLPGPQRPAQCHHLLRPQAAQADPAGPVVPGQEAEPALTQPGQLPRAGRHHYQHLIGLQPTHREQPRPCRRPIRPLQVIGHH